MQLWECVAEAEKKINADCTVGLETVCLLYNWVDDGMLPMSWLDMKYPRVAMQVGEWAELAARESAAKDALAQPHLRDGGAASSEPPKKKKPTHPWAPCRIPAHALSGLRRVPPKRCAETLLAVPMGRTRRRQRQKTTREAQEHAPTTRRRGARSHSRTRKIAAGVHSVRTMPCRRCAGASFLWMGWVGRHGTRAQTMRGRASCNSAECGTAFAIDCVPRLHGDRCQQLSLQHIAVWRLQSWPKAEQ